MLSFSFLIFMKLMLVFLLFTKMMDKRVFICYLSILGILMDMYVYNIFWSGYFNFFMFDSDKVMMYFILGIFFRIMLNLFVFY